MNSLAANTIANTSDDNEFSHILQQRLSRRQALKGGVTLAGSAIFASLGLTACSDDDVTAMMPSAPPKLGFTAIAKSVADLVTVPSGYNVSVLYALGDSFRTSDTAWSDAGSETGASYEFRAGDHHDGLYFFGLNSAGTGPDANNNERGILCMNHEAPNPFNPRTGVNNLYIHPNGATVMVSGTGSSAVANRTVPDEVVKEINAHGVSVLEVRKSGGVWSVVKDSLYNRRITGATTMNITGPLRGNAAMITRFSPSGTQTQGTINNCAVGFTPWGTYLTCEENWVGYFSRAAGDNARRARSGEVASLARYGSGEGSLQRVNWDTAGTTDFFRRWNTSVTGASADGSDDFRNVINQFGYTVEIDPYSATAVPAKRTAMGRFAKEGAWPGRVVVGKPIVFYMGDDNRGDYIYKFVSSKNWVASDANRVDRMTVGSEYLDAGKLYVAKFNADGSGIWLEVAGVAGALDTRIAADALGATRMDRPEWGAVNPKTGEVYITLTNNNAANRLVTGTPTGNAALTDGPNPRVYNDARTTGAAQNGNPNGHIIRWRETVDDSSALAFRWDIYLFGARAAQTDTANINISRLSADNDFSSPDGLWFGRPGNAAEGLLWIQTDDGAYTRAGEAFVSGMIEASIDYLSQHLTHIGDAELRRGIDFFARAFQPAARGD